MEGVGLPSGLRFRRGSREKVQDHLHDVCKEKIFKFGIPGVRGLYIENRANRSA